MITLKEAIKLLHLKSTDWLELRGKYKNDIVVTDCAQIQTAYDVNGIYVKQIGAHTDTETFEDTFLWFYVVLVGANGKRIEGVHSQIPR